MFKNQIVKLQSQHDMTRVDFAKSIGVSEGTVRGWETGRREPKLNTIEHIAKVYNVSPAWLSGYGEEVSIDDEVELNFYGSVSAGNFEEVQQVREKMNVPVSIFKNIDAEECFVIRVNGDSMNRVLANGTYVVVHDYRNSSYEPKTSDILLIRNGSSHTLKRVRVTDTKIHFEPDSYIDEFVTETYDIDYSDDIEVIGRVIFNFRSFI